MPWARIDDTLYDHPKMLALLDEREGMVSVGLFTLLLSYCNRHLTDGAFTMANVKRLGGNQSLVTLLVKHGFVDEGSDGYRVHDFLTYSKGRAKVEAEREAWRARQQRSRGDVTQVSRSDNGVSHAVTPTSVTPLSHSPVPVPVPPPVPGALTRAKNDGLTSIGTTTKKPADEERIDFLLGRWTATVNTPATRQTIKEQLVDLGIFDPDAELARRAA